MAGGWFGWVKRDRGTRRWRSPHCPVIYSLTRTIAIHIYTQAEASHALSSGAGALPAGQQHLATMGKMIEGLEIQLRGDLDALYLQRTREIVHAVRKAGDGGGEGGGGEAAAAAGEGDSSSSSSSGGGSSGVARRPPPAGSVRLPGMPIIGVPAGHQESLLEAINRRRVQRQAQEGAEHVVEG
jgi:hypothetical protein